MFPSSELKKKYLRVLFDESGILERNLFPDVRFNFFRSLHVKGVEVEREVLVRKCPSEWVSVHRTKDCDKIKAMKILPVRTVFVCPNLLSPET